MNPELIYPRPADKQTVYLKNVIHDSAIQVGEFSIYNDFVNDPVDFEKNNVLYHYPINPERLIIGKFCSVACGAKFMFTSGNHALKSLSSFPFGIFTDDWGIPFAEMTKTWDNRGDIVIGNDVWIGYEAVIMQGVTIGDGAIIGSRAVVTKNVEPYSIVGGVPARFLRKRFDDDTVSKLLALQWWNWPTEKIRANLTHLVKGQIDELFKVNQ